MYFLSVEIKGKIDAISLWGLIEKYHINLTNLDDVTYVYGDVELHKVGEIISRCALFGELSIIVRHKGG